MSAADNNLVRFKSITKKKDGVFANYKVTGLKGGASFNSSISVDITQAEVDAGDPLEKIVSECAKIAVKMSEAKFQFEGLASL